MEPGKLTVASEPTEMGSGQNSITAAVEGEDQEEINFNCRLLLDALSVVSTSEVEFQIGVMKIKVNEKQTISAPAGVLKPVGQNTCVHSFMSLSSNL
jgi:DNA polymerase III sliding clamp (beta) subunit (PCNA family)